MANFPEGLLNYFRGAAQCPVDRSWCAQRCCDGAATESMLRRRCADQLRRAHSARRVHDGADAAATELMLRAALLRRSCDGAAQTSSVALILRVASRRDALNEEPASFSLVLIQISMVVARSPRHPPGPVISFSVLNHPFSPKLSVRIAFGAEL